MTADRQHDGDPRQLRWAGSSSNLIIDDRAEAITGSGAGDVLRRVGRRSVTTLQAGNDHSLADCLLSRRPCMTADIEISNDTRATALAAHFETEIVRRVSDPVARAAALTVLSRAWWHAIAGDDADRTGDRRELAEP